MHYFDTTEWSNCQCAPDDRNSKNTEKYSKQLQSLTIITSLELGITDGVSFKVDVFRPEVFYNT
jgi:hypothetical protein